jgi:hypothetical protein
MPMLPDVTLTLGSPTPIRVMGLNLTAQEAHDLARELEAAADLADRRASRDLEHRVGLQKGSR